MRRPGRELAIFDSRPEPKAAPKPAKKSYKKGTDVKFLRMRKSPSLVNRWGFLMDSQVEKRCWRESVADRRSTTKAPGYPRVPSKSTPGKNYSRQNRTRNWRARYAPKPRRMAQGLSRNNPKQLARQQQSDRVGGRDE